MSGSKSIIIISDPIYKQWVEDIGLRFKRQQIKAAIHINSDKIEFYCKRFYLLYSQAFETVKYQ